MRESISRRRDNECPAISRIAPSGCDCIEPSDTPLLHAEQRVVQQIAPWHEWRDIRARERDWSNAVVERGHTRRSTWGWHVDRNHPLITVTIVVANVEVAVCTTPPLITDLRTAWCSIRDGNGA